MTSTRRTFLKGAGLAVMAGAVARAGAESPPAQGASAAGKNTIAEKPRGLTVCNLQGADGISLGVRTKRGIVDVRRAAKARRISAPATTDDLVRGRNVAGLEKLLADESALAKFLVAEQDARFGPCIASPEKIIMMGFNYKKHVAEVKVPMPTSPVFFNKYNNSLVGHGATIHLPGKVARKFDYEVELVVVMGRTARDVAPADALSYVWGYATGNDFSARDLQFKTSQFMLGKTSDGFAPLGPWLVSADLVGDPQNLKLECRVNGEVRQSSNTNDMIFSSAELVSYASQHMTLQPGDIFFTGTPEGVILGKPEAQQVWLKAGDRISTEVEKLGELRFDLA
jgi:2-keto-4-pentenoate hydratase/2-oxohepta-3-ene-1,7-dioic acid hydratase in catechol pathway